VRRFLALFGLLSLLPTASVAGTLAALPVARGLPGNGAWTLEVWAEHGCTTCKVDQADFDALNAFVESLYAKPSASSVRELPVTMVGVSDSQGEESSLAKLRQAVAECSVGSGGILSPNHVTSIVAYGVRFDCPESDHSQFLSVVFGKSHTPVALFWLPDRPIYVSDH
jgi:hypothetical protein